MSDSQTHSWQGMKSKKGRQVLLKRMDRKLHLLLIGQVQLLKFKQKQTQKNKQPNKNQPLNSKRSKAQNLQPYNKNLEFKYSQTRSFATTFSSQGPQSLLLAESCHCWTTRQPSDFFMITNPNLQRQVNFKNYRRSPSHKSSTKFRNWKIGRRATTKSYNSDKAVSTTIRPKDPKCNLI